MALHLFTILLLTGILSFVTGSLAGRKAKTSIESSMTDIFRSIELAEEIHQLNKKVPAKVQGPSQLMGDPQM